MKRNLGKIAIIGAGIAGMNCAYQLSKIADITVFEKSRGFGGRMSTKLIDGFQFDHGIQFFTAKTKIFQDFIYQFEKKGIIKSWEGNFVEINNNQVSKIKKWDNKYKHYVPVPKMSSFCRYLSEGIDVKLNTRITKLVKLNTKWEVFNDQSSLGIFDWVIIAIPPEQLMPLITDFYDYLKQIRDYKMQPCYSLMIGSKNSLDIEWDAAIIKNSILSWISINDSKPLRNRNNSIVAISTNDWAQENIKKDIEYVKNTLLTEIQKIFLQLIKNIEYLNVHKWRYANIKKQNGVKSIIDSKNRLGICGDWFIKGTAESAFLSSNNLIDNISTHI
ncbi:NAD(P)/FAD-dependent oxidoreductase [Rickettsiales endosymbiont of Trichoplax sp. H2]|uniref:NAD(P)/FAD-dependent oxidoreductase n=1 Tax=Rickettsiales endosymbiont of Trichoplax sp. H2 TaxID=2021221 RepID=UPI0012B2D4FE|nr:NAD(P)-binding protein [Rickettsiales endosymbiont of Trichoplax sp. H2]MSO14163.1 Renalase [Rickettsiales endosymbiont of Trichoplax sp. H2]